MKRLALFCLGLAALDMPFQLPVAAQNAPTDAPLTELSPPARNGRRGGVYVTGSTNPFSLGITNAAGGTGGSYSSSTGAYTNTGASTGRLSSVLVTNSNGLVSTNYLLNSNSVAQPAQVQAPAQIGSDPPVIITPGVPGTVRTINPNTGREVNANNAAANANAAAQGNQVVQPPPAASAPQGNLSTLPQARTAEGPPATAPRGTPSPPPPLAPPLPTR
jgi:hypothetical protein